VVLVGSSAVVVEGVELFGQKEIVPISGMYGRFGEPGCSVLSTLISALPKIVYVVVYAEVTDVGRVPLTVTTAALPARVRTVTSATCRLVPACRQVALRLG
jgi:hypothetical protein